MKARFLAQAAARDALFPAQVRARRLPPARPIFLVLQRCQHQEGTSGQGAAAAKAKHRVSDLGATTHRALQGLLAAASGYDHGG